MVLTKVRTHCVAQWDEGNVALQLTPRPRRSVGPE